MSLQTYRVCIGTENNRKTTVEKINGNLRQEYSTPEILHPAQLQSFWLEFEENSLRLGKGLVNSTYDGEIVFDITNITEPVTVNSLSFTGWAWWTLIKTNQTGTGTVNMCNTL